MKLISSYLKYNYACIYIPPANRNRLIFCLVASNHATNKNYDSILFVLICINDDNNNFHFQ